MVLMKLINARDTKIFTITNKVEDIVKAADKIGHPKVSENFYDGFREANFMQR